MLPGKQILSACLRSTRGPGRDMAAFRARSSSQRRPLQSDRQLPRICGCDITPRCQPPGSARWPCGCRPRAPPPGRGAGASRPRCGLATARSPRPLDAPAAAHRACMLPCQRRLAKAPGGRASEQRILARRLRVRPQRLRLRALRVLAIGGPLEGLNASEEALACCMPNMPEAHCPSYVSAGHEEQIAAAGRAADQIRSRGRPASACAEDLGPKGRSARGLLGVEQPGRGDRPLRPPLLDGGANHLADGRLLEGPEALLALLAQPLVPSLWREAVRCVPDVRRHLRQAQHVVVLGLDRMEKPCRAVDWLRRGACAEEGLLRALRQQPGVAAAQASAR